MRITEEIKKLRESKMYFIKKRYKKRLCNRKDINLLTDIAFRIQALLDTTDYKPREREEIEEFILEPLWDKVMKHEMV